MVEVYAYRGDNRDEDTLRNSGGFVPKYLLNEHAGGFSGFISCLNKTPRELGCNCPGFNKGSLHAKARIKLLEILKDPGILQEHVAFNNKGFLATATERTDAYEAMHKYKITVNVNFHHSIESAREILLVTEGKVLNSITKNFFVSMDSDRLSGANLIAAVPHKGVELTFLSPIECKYIEHI